MDTIRERPIPNWIIFGARKLGSATLERARKISVMPEDDKKQVFLVLDTLIRDYKTRKAYAQ